MSQEDFEKELDRRAQRYANFAWLSWLVALIFLAADLASAYQHIIYGMVWCTVWFLVFMVAGGICVGCWADMDDAKEALKPGGLLSSQTHQRLEEKDS